MHREAGTSYHRAVFDKIEGEFSNLIPVCQRLRHILVALPDEFSFKFEEALRLCLVAVAE